MSLQGKRIFITGGSRGIGLAIALRAAQDGALVAIAAKTSIQIPSFPEQFIQLPKKFVPPVALLFQSNVTFVTRIRLHPL